MELNKCEFRIVLTNCCNGRKFSTEELPDIQNTIMQSSKSRGDAFEL